MSSNLFSISKKIHGQPKGQDCLHTSKLVIKSYKRRNIAFRFSISLALSTHDAVENAIYESIKHRKSKMFLPQTSEMTHYYTATTVGSCIRNDKFIVHTRH